MCRPIYSQVLVNKENVVITEEPSLVRRPALACLLASASTLKPPRSKANNDGGRRQWCWVGGWLNCCNAILPQVAAFGAEFDQLWEEFDAQFNRVLVATDML